MCSLAELDKKRATAIASKEGWLLRSSKKSSEISACVNEILDDISNAEKALELQKLHIHELHQMYTDTWDSRQEVILRSHNAKILELQELCQAKGQIQASPDNASTSLMALQAQVVQLLAQLASLGVQPIVACGVAVPVELVTGAETMDSGTGTRNPALDLGTGTCNPEAKPAFTGSDMDVAELSSTVLSSSDKGKGKGKDKGNANY